MPIMNKIDKKLAEMGKTRYWLAQQIGMDFDNLSHICKNTRKMIKWDSVEKICKVLDCNIGDLWECELLEDDKKD